MKKIVITVVTAIITGCCFAQNIFTYGNKAVTKTEFVNAFNKNPNISTDRATALKEYLDLYIKFKLKVQAAVDAGLDKDATQQFELQNFRNQIAENIINEQANVKTLVKEAFERSRKEIHLAQVFIEVPGNADTAEAYKNIYAAYRQLQGGKDFGAVSQQFSTDDVTKQSKGDLGYVTTFTLPYNLENIAYNLKINSFSAPVKTKAGYHIFKNRGERASRGARKVAQIFVSLVPNATETEKNIAAKKADSIYNLLQKGVSFEDLASTISDDANSNTTKGELPEFNTGTYSTDFEDAAFALQKAGDISKPFQTAYGFHILKLLEVKSAAADLDDPVMLANLTGKVTKDSRMENSKKELMKKKLSVIKYKPAKFSRKDLFIFTDSALLRAKPLAIKGISTNTLLFSFAKENVKAGDWVAFVRSLSTSPDQRLQRDYTGFFKEFLQTKANDYYQKHLEDYDFGYEKQIKEFKEANLLFGIMEKNVWSKASSDTAGLIQYYNLYKSKYTWQPSADAIIITCNSLKLLDDLQQKLKDSLGDWRKIIANYGSAAAADSSRFELGQLSVVDRTNFTKGLRTAPVKNANEGTYTFNYIVNVYREPAARSFEDARGMVISDYQQAVEDNWIAELKKKYPVSVNTAVFKTIK